MTATKLDELSVNDFDDAADHVDLTTDIRSGSEHGDRADESAIDDDLFLCAVAATPEAFHSAVARLARGTEPDVTAAQLHAALTVVRDLLGVLDLKAHMFQPSQDAIWRARQLLREHGVTGCAGRR